MSRSDRISQPPEGKLSGLLNDVIRQGGQYWDAFDTKLVHFMSENTWPLCSRPTSRYLKETPTFVSENEYRDDVDCT